MALLELTGVSKSFGGVQALRDVDFTLLAGQIHGLAGENGAGKSTMMKIIAGVHPADAGRMRVDGREVHFRSSRDALAAGIGMVHQELSVAPELSVAENVFLGSQPVDRFGIVAWRRMAEAAAVQLRNLGLDIDPRARLGDFPIGVQQLVELSRVLFSGARIIILDEPTSALSPPEIERLFAVLDKLRESGRSIIFISHFLDDILKISNAITIFRNGRKVATTDVTPAIDKGWIIERMIGSGREELEESYLGQIRLDSRPEAPVALRARELTLAPAYRDISFQARAGEVLGIYGFMGCGQLELARTLFGRLRADSGSLEIDGAVKTLSNTTAAKKAGVAYVAESRRSMLFGDEPVYKNVSISILERLSRWLLKPDREREIAAAQTKNSRHPPARHRIAPRRSFRRQSAEGRAGEMADPRAPNSAARRADAGHGRRRQGGRRQDRARFARSGHRDRRLLDRAGNRSVARRSGAGDAQGRDRARIRERGDQQGSSVGGGLTRDF